MTYTPTSTAGEIIASSANPIADALGIEPSADKRVLMVGARRYELYPRGAATVETMYRAELGAGAGYGVPNPGFSLAMQPDRFHVMLLGQYLARPRQSVKRAEAAAIVEAARAELASR